MWFSPRDVPSLSPSFFFVGLFGAFFSFFLFVFSYHTTGRGLVCRGSPPLSFEIERVLRALAFEAEFEFEFESEF